MGQDQVDATRVVADALLVEQAAFAALLHQLETEDWDRPSLCPAWTVRDVVRHAAFHIHRQGFRETNGSTAKYEAVLAARAHADTIDGLVAWFESPMPAAMATNKVNLSEVVIHQLDVRWALGRPRAVPEPTLVRTLDHCTTPSGSLFVVNRPRRAGRGLRLEATDSTWTKGKGPVVSGTAEALLLAVSGRAEVVEELRGPGVEVLAGHLVTDRLLGT